MIYPGHPIEDARPVYDASFVPLTRSRLLSQSLQPLLTRQVLLQLVRKDIAAFRAQVRYEHVEEHQRLFREILYICAYPLPKDLDDNQLLPVVVALHQTRHESLRVHEVGVCCDEGLNEVAACPRR